jgi:signal transduction histidine kinase
MGPVTPSYQEIADRLKQAEEIIGVLRCGQADAIIGDHNVLLLRLREVQEQLQHNSEVFKQSLTGAKVSVAHLDRDLRCTWVFNPTAGFPDEAILTTHGDQQRLTPGPALAPIAREVLEKGVTIRKELSVAREDGRLVFDATFSPRRDAHGEIVGLTCVATDITEYKLLEDELNHYRLRLEQLTGPGPLPAAPAPEPPGPERRDVATLLRAEREAQQAREQLDRRRMLSIQADRLRAIGEMSAGMIHEFSQPLHAIRATAESQAINLERGRDPDPARLKEAMDLIIGQADRMTYIMEHVRRFARGSEDLALEPLEINEVIQESMTIVDFQLKRPGIKIGLDLAPKLPPVLANAYSLEEVILNLVANARDAMIDKLSTEPDTAAEIDLSTALAVEDGRAFVQIIVRDRGVGIPEHVLPHIFLPFFTTKDPAHGTGLGLSISRSIVERFHGDIAAASVPGQGATVTVSLPAADL